MKIRRGLSAILVAAAITHGTSRGGGPVRLLSAGNSLSQESGRNLQEKPRESAEPEPMPGDLDALRAIGYVDWDEEADLARSGVTVHDTTRCCPGYQLFTDGVAKACVLDMDGRMVHAWEVKGGQRCGTFELLEKGEVLVIDMDGRKLVRLDFFSNVIWQKSLAVHHDLGCAANGDVLVLIRGRPFDWQGRHVYFDGIARLSSGGEEISRWLAFKSLDVLRALHPASALDLPADPPVPAEKPFDYYHMNSLEVLPATPLSAADSRFRPGNLLVCCRNTNLILVLDQETMAPTWHFGPGVLEMPHMPTMLASGNVLLFDNGPFRKYSRVLEVDPRDSSIVWSYEGRSRGEFFSAWRGSCQRLENGNTLICESERGRAFEVTRDGDVVWEFWNPELSGGKRRRIYRMTRVPCAILDPLLAASPAKHEEEDR